MSSPDNSGDWAKNSIFWPPFSASWSITTDIRRDTYRSQIGEKREMKNTERLVLTPLAAAKLVEMASFQATDAGEEYVSKARTKTLYKAPLQGVHGKEMFVKYLSAPPNFVGGKHMHPDPVFVYVLEGELTVERARGPKTFKAGELY